MIKFKDLFETVYEPRSGDEKNFKDKHVIMKIKTPYDTEDQFTYNTKKAKRKADYDENDCESVYEAANVHTKRADKQPVIVHDVDPKTGQSRAKVELRRAGEIKIGEEVEQIDEISKKTLGSYVKKAATSSTFAGTSMGTARNDAERSATGKTITKRLLGLHRATDRLAKEEVDLSEGIDKMSDSRLKFHATKGFPHGSYTRKEIEDEHKRRMKAVPNYHTVKPSLSEEADLDEKVKNPYAIGTAAAMKQTGDRPPLKKSTIVKGHEIAKSIKNEAMDPVGYEDADINNDGKVNKSDKYLHARRKVIGKALRKEEVNTNDNTADEDNKSFKDYIKSNKPVKIKSVEESYLDEAFKVGAMKLHDGSSVTLTRESVDSLNVLFHQLNPINKSKMEDRMMSGKRGFQEILSFAENI